MPRTLPSVLTIAVVPILTSAESAAFEDPALESAVREALDQPSGPVDTSDLAAIPHLDASDRRITSLEGLQNA